MPIRERSHTYSPLGQPHTPVRRARRHTYNPDPRETTHPDTDVLQLHVSREEMKELELWLLEGYNKNGQIKWRKV
jgi:hypothetical protein